MDGQNAGDGPHWRRNPEALTELLVIAKDHVQVVMDGWPKTADQGGVNELAEVLATLGRMTDELEGVPFDADS